MSEAVAAAVEPTPLGAIESLTEYRERKAEASADPVETPEAKPVEAADAVPEAGADPDAASEAGKALAAKKGSLQARIDDLTRKAGETERQYKAREADLLAQLETLKPKAEPVKTADPAKPKAADFENYEDFVDALADYRADLKVKALTAQLEQRQQGQQAASAQQRVEAAAKAAHADFDDTIAEFVAAGHTFSPVVGQAILGHPLGHELAYALAKNPEANARIAAAPNEYIAGIEIGQVLATLTKPAAAEKPAPVVSQAPVPVKPVASGGSATAVGTPDPSNISTVAGWRKARKNYL